MCHTVFSSSNKPFACHYDPVVDAYVTTEYRVIFAQSNFCHLHFQTVSPRLEFARTVFCFKRDNFEILEVALSIFHPLTTRAKVAKLKRWQKRSCLQYYEENGKGYTEQPSQ